ncbi:MAG: hypothetical protein ACMXYK_01355 [Candidatus Woesearchaeota archaeon]
MAEIAFFKKTCALLSISLITFFAMLHSIPTTWYATQLTILAIASLATLFAITEMKQKKATVTTLIICIYGSLSLNALYIASVHISLYLGILLVTSITGIYYTARHMNIYKKVHVLEELQRQAQLLKQAEESLQEVLKQKQLVANKENNKTVKKSSSKKVAKKKTNLSKKTTTKTAKKSKNAKKKTFKSDKKD